MSCKEFLRQFKNLDSSWWRMAIWTWLMSKALLVNDVDGVLRTQDALHRHLTQVATAAAENKIKYIFGLVGWEFLETIHNVTKKTLFGIAYQRLFFTRPKKSIRNKAGPGRLHFSRHVFLRCWRSTTSSSGTSVPFFLDGLPLHAHLKALHVTAVLTSGQTQNRITCHFTSKELQAKL